jgi:hypothetical protein
MDVSAAKIEMVHETSYIVRPDRHIITLEGTFRLSVATHIEINAAEAF